MSKTEQICQYLKKSNFARIWLISVNKAARLRTRLVFKTVAGNKEHEFIGQNQNGDFVKFYWPSQKTKTLRIYSSKVHIFHYAPREGVMHLFDQNW